MYSNASAELTFCWFSQDKLSNTRALFLTMVTIIDSYMAAVFTKGALINMDTDTGLVLHRVHDCVIVVPAVGKRDGTRGLTNESHRVIWLAYKGTRLASNGDLWTYM